MSMLTRFGRTEAALDYVDPSAKEAFAERRAPWEKELRVLDVELTDLRLNTKDDADVVLNVMWQRLDESDVRETQLEQHWRDGRKGWKLVSESAKGGDKALLPPPPKTDEAKATAPPKQL